jgi:hypothetical protein
MQLVALRWVPVIGQMPLLASLTPKASNRGRAQRRPRLEFCLPGSGVDYVGGRVNYVGGWETPTPSHGRGLGRAGVGGWLAGK